MPNEQQQNHASNLKAAQRSALKSSAQNIKKNVKSAADVISLMAYIDPFMDWLFGIALIFAIIKDIMDLADTALIAAGGVGLALIFITTSICSLSIFFIMLLTGSSGKGKAIKGLAKRFGILAGTTIIECVPGIDVLPLESIIVIAIVVMTLIERKNVAQEARTQVAANQPEQNPQFTTRAEQQLA